MEGIHYKGLRADAGLERMEKNKGSWLSTSHEWGETQIAGHSKGFGQPEEDFEARPCSSRLRKEAEEEQKCFMIPVHSPAEAWQDLNLQLTSPEVLGLFKPLTAPKSTMSSSCLALSSHITGYF